MRNLLSALMAIYILVHGGGHGGWCYQPVAALLRHAGHNVYTPTLSGLADRSHLLCPEIGLATHVSDIANLLWYEDLSDVILVGHSYGGMVITGAADCHLDRIKRLVYLDAAIPHDGEALIDVSPGLRALMGTIRNVGGVETVLWPEGPVLDIYGLRGSPYEDWAKVRLTPHPWKSFIDPLYMMDPNGMQNIPRTIVNCSHSLALRPEATRCRWLNSDDLWEIDTGHDLMLTEPVKVAEILRKLA